MTPNQPRPLRIAHLNTERTWRGGELQTLQTAHGLHERGHASRVIAQPGSPLAARARELGVPVEEIRMHGEVDPGAVLRLAGSFRRTPVDIVHMHTSHAHTLGCLAARATGRGKTIVSRRVDFTIHRNRFRTNALKYRYGVDRYIAISEAVKAQLVRDGISGTRISIVPSGIVPRRFDGIVPADLHTELGLEPGAPLIGNVAHFGWHKAQEYLVRAAPLLRRTHPNAVILLIGEGECFDRIETEARELGVAGDAVRFLGFRDDVPQILAALDVFVMCSVLEGLCTSILDALASRVPVVASRAGGMPEIVDHGNGLLVPPREPSALAAAIARFLDEPELRRETIERGRRTVEEKFSVDATVTGTLAVYRKVLEANAT